MQVFLPVRFGAQKSKFWGNVFFPLTSSVCFSGACNLVSTADWRLSSKLPASVARKCGLFRAPRSLSELQRSPSIQK